MDIDRSFRQHILVFLKTTATVEGKYIHYISEYQICEILLVVPERGIRAPGLPGQLRPRPACTQSSAWWV